jgi:hypothetical protein
LKKLLPIIFVVVCCLFVTVSKGQSLTAADFKLCLDTFGCKNRISLTKKQLLEADKFEANFNFLHIKSLTIYIGSGCTAGNSYFNKGNILSKEMKKIFERIPANESVPIFITASGVNNSGKEINWGGLTIFIKE